MYQVSNRSVERMSITPNYDALKDTNCEIVPIGKGVSQIRFGDTISLFS